MSTTLRFVCPSCSKRLKADARHAGRKAKCSCGQTVVVPSAPMAGEDGLAKAVTPSPPVAESLEAAQRARHWATLRLGDAHRRVARLRRQATRAGIGHNCGKVPATVRRLAQKAPLGRLGAAIIVCGACAAIAVVAAVAAGPGGWAIGLAVLAVALLLLYVPKDAALATWLDRVATTRLRLTATLARARAGHRDCADRVSLAEQQVAELERNQAAKAEPVARASETVSANRAAASKPVTPSQETPASPAPQESSAAVASAAAAPPVPASVPSAAPGPTRRPYGIGLAFATVVVLLVGASVTLVWWANQMAERESAEQSPLPAPAREGEEIAKLRQEISKLRDEAKQPKIENVESIGPPPAANAATAHERKTEELVRLLEPSVVKLEVTGADGARSGSGFVVREDGLAVTNYHVLEGARSVTAVLRDGTRLQVAGLVAVVPEKDLALFHCKSAGKLKALPLARRLPEKGASVLALGSPLGLAATVTDGIVSGLPSGSEAAAALDNWMELPGGYRTVLGFSVDVTWVQTTAPISPGNSGGPLVNMEGEVVGVNTWMMPPTNSVGTRRAQNINFAMSGLEVARLVEESGDKPLLALSDLPAPRRVEPLPKPVAAPPSAPAARAAAPDYAAEQRQLEELRKVYNERVVILVKLESLKARMEPVQAAYTAACARLARLNQDIMVIQQTGAGIEQQVVALRQRLLWATDPDLAASIQASIETKQAQYAVCVQGLAARQKDAYEVRTYGANLESQMAGHQAELAQIKREADALEKRWLAAVAALGGLRPERAIATATEWITLNSTSYEPYVFRGFLYEQQGQKDLARRDYTRAV